MSYITNLGLTLTFDARLQCLYMVMQPDVDGKCYWLLLSISYSQVNFWHAHLYLKNILAGYSFETQAQA